MKWEWCITTTSSSMIRYFWWLLLFTIWIHNVLSYLCVHFFFFWLVDFENVRFSFIFNEWRFVLPWRQGTLTSTYWHYIFASSRSTLLKKLLHKLRMIIMLHPLCPFIDTLICFSTLYHQKILLSTIIWPWLNYDYAYILTVDKLTIIYIRVKTTIFIETSYSLCWKWTNLYH